MLSCTYVRATPLLYCYCCVWKTFTSNWAMALANEDFTSSCFAMSLACRRGDMAIMGRRFMTKWDTTPDATPQQSSTSFLSTNLNSCCKQKKRKSKSGFYTDIEGCNTCPQKSMLAPVAYQYVARNICTWWIFFITSQQEKAFSILSAPAESPRENFSPWDITGKIRRYFNLRVFMKVLLLCGLCRGRLPRMARESPKVRGPCLSYFLKSSCWRWLEWQLSCCELVPLSASEVGPEEWRGRLAVVLLKARKFRTVRLLLRLDA